VDKLEVRILDLEKELTNNKQKTAYMNIRYKKESQEQKDKIQGLNETIFLLRENNEKMLK
jgi:hypothetical protein